MNRMNATPMRLNLKLTANTGDPVPYNHLHWLTGFLHRCVGESTLHDQLSLYSFGWLGGGWPRRRDRPRRNMRQRCRTENPGEAVMYVCYLCISCFVLRIFLSTLTLSANRSCV